MRKVTLEEFIERARKVHGDKYDYSKVKLIDTHTPVTIICPIHGEFSQIPKDHMRGIGCKKCGIIRRAHLKNNGYEGFITKARQIHGDKYDYSKVVYVKSDAPVTIICPIHGEFSKTPSKHLSGQGCQKCAKEHRTIEQTQTLDEVKTKIKSKYGDKYIVLTNAPRIPSKIPIEFFCTEHNVKFQATTNALLRGTKKCPVCGKESLLNALRSTKDEFIENARKVHGDKYDYSKVIYKGNKKSVIITCSIHGDFLQTPNNHLNGHGCPSCNQSHLEREIEILLKENNIEYKYNKRYKFLNGLQLDFFIPSFNIAIECQGEQHFFVNYSWHKNIEEKKKQFQLLQQRDALKRELCEKNGIKLLYYSDLGIDYPYEVIEDKNLILEELIIAKDKLL